MKLAVFGGTGTVGLRLLRAAVDRGFEVKALVRTPAKLGNLADELVVIEGDYFDPEMVRRTIEGTSAVLSTLGPPVGRGHAVKPEAFERGMRSVVDAMKVTGVGRIITISSSATSYEGETIALGRKFFRTILKLHSPVMTPSKEKELAVLMDSDTQWTSIRPPIITDAVEGQLRLSHEKKMGIRVNTSQLVHFMLDTISSDEWVGKAPFVATH